MGVYPENSTLIPLLWRGGAQHRGGPIRDSFAPELTGHEPPRPERAPLEECDHPALTGTPPKEGNYLNFSALKIATQSPLPSRQITLSH